MLRNVVADFLDNIKRERDFDAPFLTLLPALGYFDIHFTHGISEYGKDFIAKKHVNGNIVQFSFQSKAGDIGQSDWRNEIQGQMLESVMNGLSHPNFDTTLAHQPVLVFTGRLVGNAPVSAQQFNSTLQNGSFPTIEIWDEEKLIPFFISHGPEAVYHLTASGLSNYGRFFIYYGSAVRGELTAGEIESFSEELLKENVPSREKLLATGVITSALSAKCKQSGRNYEALISEIAHLRAIHFILSEESDPKRKVELRELLTLQLRLIESNAATFTQSVRHHWFENDKNFLRLIEGHGSFITYPISCLQTLEVAALYALVTDDDQKKQEAIEFIEEFIQLEEGSQHPISDRYAVSIVAVCLALLASGKVDTATKYLKHIAVWAIDQYEQRDGIASLEEDEVEIIRRILGSSFSSIETDKLGTSFLATALCDLSCLIGNKSLYEDIVNDIKATYIYPQYWQPQDTLGKFFYSGDDVIQYPHVEFSDSYSDFSLLNHATHITNEPRYENAQNLERLSLIALSLLLRDRYFPTIWQRIITTNYDLSLLRE